MDRLNKLVGRRQKKRRDDEKGSSLTAQSETRLRELQTMPYHDYLLSPEWQEKRKGAMQRAEYKCQVCNASERLHTHHRTYERRGRELPSDLTVLCEKCHALYHQIQNPQEQIPTPTIPDDMGIDACEERYNFSSFNWRMPGVKAAFEISRKYAEDHKDCWLVLVGGNGTGKTHLAVSIARECIEKGEDVRFISTQNLLNLLSRSPKEDQINEILQKTDLLILEYVGTNTLYHNKIKTFHEILRYRHEKGLSVVITTQRNFFDKIDPNTMKLLSDRFYNPFALAHVKVVELIYARDYTKGMGVVRENTT